MKTLLPATALLLAAAASQPLWAQNASDAQAQAATPPAAATAEADKDAQLSRRNQRIERLQHQDSGSTIDELRVGGETQSITVKPRYNVPAYEVTPEKGLLGAQGGKRVWNVLKF